MIGSGFWTGTRGDDWEHGLPAGNGVIGALLYGEPTRHEITVAHERVVLPTDPPRAAPYLADDLERIRSLIAQGRAQEAADLGVARAGEQGYPGLQWTDPLVPSITVAIETDGEAQDYRREIDLDRDVATVSWRSDGELRGIEMFVSRADHAVILRLRGATESARLSRMSPRNVVTAASGVKGGNAALVSFDDWADGEDLWLSQRFTAQWPLDVTGSDAVVTRLTSDDSALLIAISVEPARAGEPDPAPWRERVSRLPKDFDVLLARHCAALAAGVKVARIELGAGPTDHAVERLLEDESPAARNSLVSVQYRAAQRLIASSTGELPPTLQGVWSGTFDPAWSSDYTMNGNVQNGSIASMLSTGNPAQLRTYLDMLERFASDFRHNSAQLFGTSGYLLPSRCSPTHGVCTHFDSTHCHEFWTAGGAWSALFFLDYAWHTADLSYLRDHAYPFAREIERFYEGFLTEGHDGVFVFSPSYSPENLSPTFGSQACRNATMDRAALACLLHGLRRAARLLGSDPELDARRAEWLRRLPPYRVAPDGTLAEWLDDGVVEAPGHRTASQLLGTWYEPDGDILTDLRDPIRAVVGEKLRWRASDGAHEEMAYGLVQLGLTAAAIGDADLALECVDRMSRLYFLPSLATTHDVGAIFNVDIAGGFPAVVNAMLVRSTVGSLKLLPAVPERWQTGSVAGVHGRGGIVVDELSWTPSHLRATLRSKPGARILREGAPLRIELPAGWRSVDAAVTGSSWGIDLEDDAAVSIEAVA